MFPLTASYNYCWASLTPKNSVSSVGAMFAATGVHSIAGFEARTRGTTWARFNNCEAALGTSLPTVLALQVGTALEGIDRWPAATLSLNVLPHVATSNAGSTPPSPPRAHWAGHIFPVPDRCSSLHHR